MGRKDLAMKLETHCLGGGLKYLPRRWFQIFFIFTPKIGEMIQFDGSHFFPMGWFKTTN